jgi:hypothetical protein
MSNVKAETAKHTPGPWKAQKLESDGLVIRKDGWEVSTAAFDVCANIQYGAPIRNEADARLIAAAPELLEALELVRMSNGWRYLCSESQQVIDAAISKAKGEL